MSGWGRGRDPSHYLARNDSAEVQLALPCRHALQLMGFQPHRGSWLGGPWDLLPHGVSESEPFWLQVTERQQTN